MSLPLDGHRNDKVLQQYLLGLLPEAATERLDEASIVDDEVAARLRVVETDLVYAHVRGQLAGETLERFESHYLSSARRREGVRLAASVVGAIDRQVARAAGVRWPDRVSRPIRVAGTAAAAALVMVVAGFLLFDFVRPRNELTPVKSERAAPGGATPVAVLTLTREGADRSPASPSPNAASQPRDARPAAPPGELVAVALPPPMRTMAPIPTFVISAGADRVRFELGLESNDFPLYRVWLKDLATSQILWRSDWMAASVNSDQAVVAVVVPANLFGTERYSLDLTGRDAGGRLEVIGSYPVRTAPR